MLSDGDISGRMLCTISKFIIFNKESYLYILPVSSKIVIDDNLSLSHTHTHTYAETYKFYIGLPSNLMSAMPFIHQKISVSTVTALNHLMDVHT